MSLDCLVVGAGPTGLLLAGELLRYGASVRVVDQAGAPSPLSRAIAVHARTLEVLDELGVAQECVDAGRPMRGVTFFSGGAPIASVSFDELDTRYPFALSLAQSETERILGGLLARRGGAVERGVELCALEQNADGVLSTLRREGGGTEGVRSRYVIGCDGAHSTVRKAAGLAFEGDAFPDGFLLADLRIDWALPADRIATFFSPDGLLACFPMSGGRWRVIASESAELAERVARATPTLAEVDALLQKRAPGLSPRAHDPSWLARFRVNSRQVTGYRSGRVFLAGDAAHIHSPAGGQGMNTGMQDAHNLAWKLAHVLAGDAPETLLDSYDVERRPIGAAVLRGTELATHVATLRNPVARAVRDAVARFVTGIDAVQTRIVRGVAELDLSYKGSAIVAEHHDSMFDARLALDDAGAESPTLSAWRAFANGPRAGERSPDAHVERGQNVVQLLSLAGGGAHTLLLFDGRAATVKGDAKVLAIVRAVRARFGDSRVRFVLVTGDARGLDGDARTGGEAAIALDREGEAEAAYGAHAECLYVIRPDLYIGYRCQRVSETRVLEHLERVLLPRV